MGETYIRQVNKLVHITINGEEIVTTDNHPFYVQGRGFINAGSLLVGDKLVSVNGEDLIVEDYHMELTEEPVSVYNFQVEDFHTYFVGDCAVWVHNKCEVTKNDDGTYDIVAEYKDGWTDDQKRYADKKCQQLTEADTKIVSKDQIDTQRQKSKSSNKKFREENNIPSNQDVDHIQDIQFGGLDIDSNKQGLDTSVNRSLGRQFKNGTNELPGGSVLRTFSMREKN